VKLRRTIRHAKRGFALITLPILLTACGHLKAVTLPPTQTATANEALSYARSQYCQAVFEMQSERSRLSDHASTPDEAVQSFAAAEGRLNAAVLLARANGGPDWADQIVPVAIAVGHLKLVAQESLSAIGFGEYSRALSLAPKCPQ
jgi:hypothetical protein